MAQHVLMTTLRASYDTLVMSKISSPSEALKALRSGVKGKKAELLDCTHFYQNENTI